MHDVQSLQLFFSTAAHCRWDRVGIFRPYVPADHMFSEITKDPEKIWVVISHDHGKSGNHVVLHDMLAQQSTQFKIFLTYSDFLTPDSYVDELYLYHRLPWCQNTMANISCLRVVASMIENEFQLEPSQKTDQWLSLNRRWNQARQYAKETYIDKLPERFVLTYQKENFLGDYDFYDSALPPETLNLKNFFTLQPLYQQTCASIVQESFGHTSFTEKTLHALLALHPFMIVGHPGTVKYLRDQGFDMFDDILDHSYDLIPDVFQRIDKLFNDNIEIIKKGINSIELKDRLIANRNHVWKFYDQSLEKLCQDFKLALQGLHAHDISH